MSNGLLVKLIANRSERFMELVSYFDSTWMNGQFKHHQWNYFNFEGPHTNNHVEGWHSKLKKVVGKSQR